MWTYFLIILVVALGSACAYLIYERYFRKIHATRSTLYVDALRDLLDNRQEAAFTKLRQVVSADANNLDAYLRLGQILREHKRPDRALQVHKDLTLRGGLTKNDKIAVLTQLALDYIDLEEPGTAQSAIKELIALDGQNHWAHTQLLRLLEESGEWEKAYDVAVDTLRIESNNSKKPLAQYKLSTSRALLQQREYHKARIILKEAIGLDPLCAEAYLMIGDSYYAEKRFEDAVSFWNKLIQAVPEQGHLAIERLKKTLFELGRFGDIVQICENILSQEPKNIEARRALAEFYQKKGETDQSEEILEQILEDVPGDLPSVLELVRAYQQKGEKRKIDQLLRRLEKNRETSSASADQRSGLNSVST